MVDSVTHFQKGDVVHATSGGPAMTISKPAVGHETEVECMWMDGNKQVFGVFDESALDRGSSSVTVRQMPLSR